MKLIILVIALACVGYNEASTCNDKSPYCIFYKPRHCSTSHPYYWSLVKNCRKTCSICTDQCGRSQSATSRVIGGKNAKPGQWPWNVAIWRKKKYACGGVLINSEFVLTSAACVSNISPSDLMVSIGETDITKPDGERYYGVFKIIKHSLHRLGKNYQHNIALIELKFHARFSSKVQPVCLPQYKQDVKPGTICYLTGWGKLKATGGPFNNAHALLQEAPLKITSSQDCRLKNAKGHPVTPDMICAASTIKGHQGACLGDFGSPLVCKTSSGAWELHGIVSWIEKTCNTDLLDTVFTRISVFSNWIEDNAKSSA